MSSEDEPGQPDAAESTPNESFIVGRPLPILQQLSLDAKWEFTRRHAYYLLFWELARLPAGEGADAMRIMRDAARLILLQIGYTAEPFPPGTSAEEIGITEQEATWRGGAVTPVLVRNLVILLHTLPLETKSAIAAILNQSMQLDRSDPAAEFAFIKSVIEGDHPNFDAMFPDLLVQINPQASLGAIASAVSGIASRYKDDHGVREHRRRDDKVDEYLAVWDRREGWNGSNYELSREKSFVEISRELGIPQQTAFERYRSAFRFIVGHDFSPDLWAKVFGWPKLAGLLGAGFPRRALQRPTRPRQPREVPETVLGSHARADQQQRFLEATGIPSSDLACFELQSDIQTLVRLGRSNAQIAEELELASDDFALIEYVRGRMADSP